MSVRCQQSNGRHGAAAPPPPGPDTVHLDGALRTSGRLCHTAGGLDDLPPRLKQIIDHHINYEERSPDDDQAVAESWFRAWVSDRKIQHLIDNRPGIHVKKNETNND